MKKEIYDRAELELIRFQTQDVLATTTSALDGGDETSTMDP